MKVLSKLKVFYNVIKHLNATLEDVVTYNRKVLLIDVLNLHISYSFQNVSI